MDTKILFVCLGNICRSPAGEGIMSHLVAQRGLADRFTVDSAGTYGGHSGDRADARMRKAASARGYDLTSVSRRVSMDDFERFDLIIAMDDSNYERLFRIAPSVEASHKIRRMAEFIADPSIDHVPDPYYEGARGFEIVLDMLEVGCNNLLDLILAQND